jgi:hypothetical protein
MTPHLSDARRVAIDRHAEAAYHLVRGCVIKHFDAVRSMARAIARSFNAIAGGLALKRCSRCGGVLRRHTIVCLRCSKWQA